MSVFVFGSNLAGKHGLGAALHAQQYYGAEIGVGEGPTGQSYALLTKDKKLSPRPLSQIARSVSRFLAYAAAHSDVEFKVTRIGCGLAGYDDEQIAPFFLDAPPNCTFDPLWEKFGFKVWR